MDARPAHCTRGRDREKRRILAIPWRRTRAADGERCGGPTLARPRRQTAPAPESTRATPSPVTAAAASSSCTANILLLYEFFFHATATTATTARHERTRSDTHNTVSARDRGNTSYCTCILFFFFSYYCIYNGGGGRVGGKGTQGFLHYIFYRGIFVIYRAPAAGILCYRYSNSYCGADRSLYARL